MNKLTLDIANKKEDFVEFSVPFSGTVTTDGFKTLNFGLDDDYEFLDVPSTISFSSTTVTDSNIEFEIYGLDENYKPISETVSLLNTGTSVVETENEFYRVNLVKRVSEIENLGNIVFVATGTTHVVSVVWANMLQSFFSVHSVPYNYEYYLDNLQVNCASDLGTKIDFDLIVDDESTKTFSVQAPLTYNYELNSPLKIDPKSDIQLKAQSDQYEADVSGVFTFFVKELASHNISYKTISQNSFFKYLEDESLDMNLNDSKILVITTDNIASYIKDGFELPDSDEIVSELPLVYHDELFKTLHTTTINFGRAPISPTDLMITTDKKYFYILYLIKLSSGQKMFVKPVNLVYGSTEYKYTIVGSE